MRRLTGQDARISAAPGRALVTTALDERYILSSHAPVAHHRDMNVEDAHAFAELARALTRAASESLA